MNTHLTIKADGKPLALKEDASIDIDFQNPIFNDVDMFSYPVEIPLEGNRELLKNIDDVHSDLRPVSMEHMDMRILADGMPFASGTAIMSDSEEVKDALSMSVEPGTQSFDDLIGDLECRDIVIPSKYKEGLLIGEKIGNVHCEMTVNTKIEIKFNTDDKEKKKSIEGTTVNDQKLTNDIEPQALGFSYPGKCQVSSSSTQAAKLKETRPYRNGHSVTVPKVDQTYINVSSAYGESMNMYKDEGGSGGGRPAYYANARVCYMHYKLDDDGQTSDELETEDKGTERENRDKYWVLDADRPQSGICFYVLFFLDCLFDYLGVTFDKSALTAIGDMNRLVFFTTHCKYDTEVIHGEVYKDTDQEVIDGKKKAGTVKSYFFNDIDSINNWLSTRGCGGQFIWEDPTTKNINDLQYAGSDGVLKSVVVGQDLVESITCTSTVVSKSISANVLAMYANADNFPDASVSTILDSLENSFGIKFSYDYEQKKVTAYLMRDVFRSQTEAIDWHGQIHSMVKISEKITGVRMCYSDESDLKDQQKYIKNQVKDYDTRYNYREYSKDRTITDLDYQHIRSQVYNTNMNCYIDFATGNAYRIKIDSDYTDADTMHPAIFEVGDLKGVEYGDCSTENEDFIVELSSDFQPVPMNDVNYHRETAALGEDPTDVSVEVLGEKYTVKNINAQAKQTMMAAFVDEDMEHEFVEQRVRNDLSTAVADAYITEVLSLVESYDPSNTDDGNSPLQSYDWGNAIAIMRGGGSDAVVQNYDANYDGFGNMKWRMVAGEYAMTIDSLDPFGSEYDYNGTQSGIGNEERFSLKIRAFKQPEWSDVPLCNADIYASAYIRPRGTWVSGETYVYSKDYIDIVIDPDDNKFYKVRKTVQSTKTPHLDTANWEETSMKPCGNWSIFTTYVNNGTEIDVVLHNSIGYKVKSGKTVSSLDPPPADTTNWEVASEQTDFIETKIRTRGLFDTFMLEYANFLLNRKKYIIRTSSTVAEVTNVQNNWKRWYRFNGMKGLINKISTTVDVKTGLGECEIEFYAL